MNRNFIRSLGASRLACAAAVALAACAPPPARADGYNTERRSLNADIAISGTPNDDGAPMELARVFARLRFQSAVMMADPPDPQGRLFIASQHGYIFAFPNKPDPQPAERTVFLDLRKRVRARAEEGLLGLAFDPDFAANGRFYVNYTAQGYPRRLIVSRFLAPSEDRGTADPASEEILLEIPKTDGNHNAGHLAFGPDEMLYIALGDDSENGAKAQDRTTLYGAILRIDVNAAPAEGLKYAIPADNPFATGAGGARREIYAKGLRNPYRFSFDSKTGDLWAGDVGQARYEEVDRIEAGKNYGWPVYEGSEPFAPAGGAGGTFTAPIFQYRHYRFSNSIVGGFAYYGGRYPELENRYLLADFDTGDIWSFPLSAALGSEPDRIASGVFNVAWLGEDRKGSIYFLRYDFNYPAGGVYTFRRRSAKRSEFPAKLSEMPGLLAAGLGRGHVAAGVHPYKPSAALWSDGAEKERYFILPDKTAPAGAPTAIAYREKDAWAFPDGSIIVKNFLLPTDRRDPAGSLKRIETRLLMRQEGDWRGYSYEWNDEGSDAALLPALKRKEFNVTNREGAAEKQTWLYPDRRQCASCHTAAANSLLGLTTAQLNSDVTFPGHGSPRNQLSVFAKLGLFGRTAPAPGTEPAPMPDPADESEPIEARARAYLAANCGMCHRPGGVTNADFDLRWETPDSATGTMGAKPRVTELGIGAAKIIAPGAPGQSVLLARMKSLDPALRMPPLASSLVDEEAAALIEKWIAALPPAEAGPGK